MASISNKSAKPNGKPVIFFHGDKGGVGKSFTCATFLDSLMRQKLSAVVVDGDPRNPDVQRMFKGNMKSAVANLRTHEGWMDLTDCMMANADLPIIVSVAAGTGEEFGREMPTFLKMVEMLERPVAMFWVVNRLPDSINLLNQTLDVVGEKLSTKVVVKNLFFGPADTFTRWDTSETRTRFEAIGGKVIGLPELHARVVDKVMANSQQVMPFSEAVVPIKEAHTSPFKLSPSENMELTMWLEQAHSVFSPFHHELGL